MVSQIPHPTRTIPRKVRGAAELGPVFASVVVTAAASVPFDVDAAAADWVIAIAVPMSLLGLTAGLVTTGGATLLLDGETTGDDDELLDVVVCGDVAGLVFGEEELSEGEGDVLLGDVLGVLHGLVGFADVAPFVPLPLGDLAGLV